MEEVKKPTELEDHSVNQENNINDNATLEEDQPRDSDSFYSGIESGDDSENPSEKNENNDNGTESGKQLVLLVDDEPDMLEILDIAMRNIGFETVLASNGADAWELYKKHRPALVISDIYMPKKNGIILLSQIKEMNEKTVVILITGRLFNASWRYKPDAFLTKPFNLSDLVNCIESATSKQNEKTEK